MSETTDYAQRVAEQIQEIAEDIQGELEEGEQFTTPRASEELCSLAPRLCAALEEAAMEEDSAGGDGEMIEQSIVQKPILSKQYHYFTHHKVAPGGKAIQIFGHRTDVTQSVSHLVEQEIGAFLQYLKDTYGLELLDPDPVQESDGQKYLYGLREKTGYELLGQAIAEWRRASVT